MTSDDHPTIHPSLFTLFLVEIHLAPTDTSPQAFQPLNPLDVDVVGILINLDECIAIARHRIRQCRKRVGNDALRVVLADEE